MFQKENKELVSAFSREKFFMWVDDVDKSINQIDKREQLEVEIEALVDKFRS